MAAARAMAGPTRLHAPMQESAGRAFLVRSINNSFVGISQLSANYTATTGLVSVAPKVS